ncbi:MAG: DMT family transporter [Ilumatobacteraceae bacterium]|nr:DMT family transporter [Ilumatobacteraceae bacterium]
MEIVIAFAAAMFYGVADYCGGRASRAVSPILVTALGQAAAFVALIILVLISGVPVAPLNDWIWGAMAGVAGATGLLAFYRAMGSGFMTVVAPISAVMMASVPVVIGLAQGERPRVIGLVAIPLGLFSVAMISDLFGPHHRRAPRSVVLLALLSGTTFGSLFVMLEHTSSGSGLWPVLAMRAASVPYMAIVVLLTRQSIRSGRKHLGIIVASGVLDSIANVLYLIAVRHGLMTIVAVIIAMYPASTLALATGLDKERVHPPQILGIALAVVSLVMLTVA